MAFSFNNRNKTKKGGKKMIQNFMFSIRVNAAMTLKLKNAGLPHVFRSKAEQEAITALYAKAAGEEKAFRLNRTDTAGNIQADGGNLRFGKDGQENVFPGTAIPDLEKHGYTLIVAEVLEKEGDNGYGFLRLTLSVNGKRVMLSGGVRDLIDLLMGRFYRKCYAYHNEEALSLQGDKSPVQGSIITLNFGGPMPENEVKQKAEFLRHLRILEGYNLRTVLEPIPAAK